MRVKNIIWEDTVNYCKPSLFIGTAVCSFKCGKENCQNKDLMDAPDIEISEGAIIQKYLDNPITEAIVLGGLEPLDQIVDVADFSSMLNDRGITDDLVIYTGYTEEEVEEKVRYLRKLNCNYRDLVVKYGRFIPDSDPVMDSTLGVELVSDNQYAVRYSRKNKTDGIHL